MVKVEHQQPRGAHELHAARAERLGALLLALAQVLPVLLRVEHAHIGEGGQLGLGTGIAATVGEDEALGLRRSHQGVELLCIASLQGLVVCVVYVIYHFDNLQFTIYLAFTSQKGHSLNSSGLWAIWM